MRVIIPLLAAAFCCASVQAQVPHQINYQGYLTGPGGTPVNTSVQMVLRLYDVPAAGVALHDETQTVAVANGVFNVLIGAQPANPLALPFNAPYWLGVAVGGDAEMTPRQAVGAVGYAIRAATAEVLAPGGNITLANPSTASAGNIMKDGSRFIHNFGTGNTFLGENAGNFSLSGAHNTGSGVNVLVGNAAGEGNTASGFQALALNQDGSYNTASGMQALFSNTSGSANTAVGLNALLNATGSNNIALGTAAGSSLTGGNDNIAVGNAGVAGESGTMRLGGASQTKTFIAGIRGVTPGNADGLPVVIDSAGQLGTSPPSLGAFQGTPCTFNGLSSTVIVSTDPAGKITFRCGNNPALNITYNNGPAPDGSSIEAGISGVVLGGVPADPPGSPRFGCGYTFSSSPLPCTAIMQGGTSASVTVTDSRSSAPFRLICPNGSTAVVEDRVTYWYAQCFFTMDSDKWVQILRP